MTFIAPAWAISGYDVAAHVAEETHNAAENVPRAMIWSTWTAGALGFAYLVSLALCATDIDALMANPLGQPIGTLLTDVLGQKAGIALLSLNIIAQFGCGVAFVSQYSRGHWITFHSCIYSHSSLPQVVSTLRTRATKLSHFLTGSGPSINALRHRTMLRLLCTFCPARLALSPSYQTPPSRPSSPAAFSRAKSPISSLSLDAVCTKTIQTILPVPTDLAIYRAS